MNWSLEFELLSKHNFLIGLHIMQGLEVVDGKDKEVTKWSLGLGLFSITFDYYPS